MSLSALFTPISPAHPNFCGDGNPLFFFVPGDTGNPFVAIWQVNLVFAVVLLVASILLLWLGRSHQRMARYLGWVYVTGTVASILLAGIAYISSTPLACNGAPGGSPLSSAEQHAYQLFEALNSLSMLMLYLTLLFLIVFVVVFIVVGVRAVWRRVRGNVPAGA
ncbi:MAG TPA: hypothetical protein VH591_15245 [Ktedonobacterales bacterium]|jgi:hypothetical protein